MFENIFNTIMDTKVKTKDNIKARMDITLFYERKNMELFNDKYISQSSKPLMPSMKKIIIYCL